MLITFQDGQGALECCSPWGRKEPDTEPLIRSPFQGAVCVKLFSSGKKKKEVTAWMTTMR